MNEEDIKSFALEFLTMKYSKAKFYYEEFYDETYLTCKNLSTTEDVYHSKEYQEDIMRIEIAIFKPHNIFVRYIQEN